MERARTARERARDENTAEIHAAARRRLASDGPSGLSLRAVARDVGMVSSAVYRYVPSRDELLTALLIEAYDELGAAAESADDAVADRSDVRARWSATCSAVRAWSVEHPHDYALLYGSPVIDYAAPRDTVGPATRVILRLAGIISAAHAADRSVRTLGDGHVPSFEPSVGPATAVLRDVAGADLDPSPELVGRTLMAWSALFGTISFELWGHLVGSVDDYESYFDSVVSRLWHDLGGV